MPESSFSGCNHLVWEVSFGDEFIRTFYLYHFTFEFKLFSGFFTDTLLLMEKFLQKICILNFKNSQYIPGSL